MWGEQQRAHRAEGTNHCVPNLLTQCESDRTSFYIGGGPMKTTPSGARDKLSYDVQQLLFLLSDRVVQ